MNGANQNKKLVTYLLLDVILQYVPRQGGNKGRATSRHTRLLATQAGARRAALPVAARVAGLYHSLLLLEASLYYLEAIFL